MTKNALKREQFRSRKRECISFYSPQASLLEQTSTKDIMPRKLNSVSSSKWRNTSAVYVLNLESGYLCGHTHSLDLCSKARYTKTSSQHCLCSRERRDKQRGTFLSESLYIQSHVSVLKDLGGPILLSTSGMWGPHPKVMFCIFAISQR